MRSKLLFLIMLILAMVVLSATVYANVVQNPGFENGTWISENSIPADWNTYNGGGIVSWYKNPAGAHDGTYYMGFDGGNWPMAFTDLDWPCTPGQTWYLGAWVKGPVTKSCDMKFEYDDPPTDGYVHFNPPSETEWTYVEGSFVVPEGMSWTGITIVGLGPGEVLYDNVWFDTFPAPPEFLRTSLVYNPDPANGAQGVPPTTTTLSWKRIKDCADNIKCELWWGKQADPNFWYVPGEAVKIMALADVNSFDLADSIGGPISLSPDEEYFWALKYEDPNDCNFGAGLIEGPTWSFDTTNRPPVVDAGLHYDTWMASGNPPITIGIDASYEDDGNPAGGIITHSWNTVAGVTYFPHQFCQDPNVTTAAPGDYILTLTTNDGEPGSDGSDIILIRIFANNDDRLRAHYKLDESVGIIASDSDNSDPCDIHNGTLHDDPAWQPAGGQVAGAIELDGTDDDEDGVGDYVSIDDTGSDPNFQADSWENSDMIDGMTISLWMKLDEDGWSKSWESVAAKSTDSWEMLRTGSGGNIDFAVKGGVGSAGSGNQQINDTQWHQVTGVYDRNTVKLYIDGIEAGSIKAGPIDLETYTHNTETWQVPKSAGKILIGNTNNLSDSPTLDTSFGGLFDQVRIFDAAVPHRADEAGTPGIVEMYRADGGHENCGGVYLPADVNEDCYITLTDFATVAFDWLDCTDVADVNCDLSHHEE